MVKWFASRCLNEDCHLVPCGFSFHSTHMHRPGSVGCYPLGRMGYDPLLCSSEQIKHKPKNLSKLNKSPLGIVSFHIWLQLADHSNVCRLHKQLGATKSEKQYWKISWLYSSAGKYVEAIRERCTVTEVLLMLQAGHFNFNINLS